MKSAASPSRSYSRPHPFAFILILIVAAAAALMTGCGSSSGSSGQKLSGSTTVTVLLSSTANDQLSQFDVGFTSLTLTSQAGNTVTLLPAAAPGSGPGAEFVQMNGTAEPLLAANIPQDVYTSATLTLTGAQFVCIELYPGTGGLGTLDTSTYNDGGVPDSNVTVSLPSPITVTGTSMGLALNMLVSQSATYSACYTPNGFSSWSITPTFTLTASTFASQPTNSANGKVTGLDGEITSIGAGGSTFTLTIPSAEGSRTVSLSANANTAYQGISGSSVLAVGTLVDMDGAIQPDGSILATRIAVEDPSAPDMLSGPMIEVYGSASTVLMLPRRQQGQDFSCCHQGGSIQVTYNNAAFQISGQLANLGTLPFVPSFSAANMVPGQNVYISVPTYSWTSGRPAASTLTLIPQTINGTVLSSSQSGNFTDYTVSLASYDLFPMLAVQPGQAAVENNPSQVEVYVDNNTQLVNSKTLAAGKTFRFYGLVFNDNGTLRMDCAQVNDGVTDSSQSDSKEHVTLHGGNVQTELIKGPAGINRRNTTVTH